MNIAKKTFILSLVSLNTFAGGIDGGGGTILPTNPISVSRVEDIISEMAKINLRTYFRYLSIADRPENRKLFSGPKTIFDALEKSSIDNRLLDPCFDSFGNPVDGSINVQGSEIICMSAYQIAPKLSEANATPNILALIAHELSHLVGYNEQEAEAFQKQTLLDLSAAGEGSAYDLVADANHGAVKFIGLIFSFDFINENFDGLATRFTSLKDSIDFDEWRNRHVLFAKQDYYYFYFQKVKLNLMRLYAVSNSSSSSAVWAKERYEKQFGGKNAVKLEDTEFLDSTSNPYKNLLINKINSKTELITQLKEVSDYVYNLKYYFEGLSRSDALVKIMNPNLPIENPWMKFLGTYSAVSVKCSSYGKPSYGQDLGTSDKFEITEYLGNPDVYGASLAEYKLGVAQPSYTGLYLDLKAESGSIGAGEINGDAGKATYSYQVGDLWRDSSVISNEIEISGNHFKFTKKLQEISLTKGSSATFCEYDLEKIK